ncbi:alpha/beta fold hydrolase [Rhodococcus sp. NPDC127530]|uniref:alpha/beta fold hydrolase n=1 Tax=unclassified Rhodococcus (in: high G+C Gram-positive bacteria) TaxID=192944 RepID=UPI00362E1515
MRVSVRMLALGCAAIAPLGLVSACGSRGGPAPDPDTSSAATYTAAACPSPNVSGVPQLDLGPGFSCGTLTVPEDRSRPDGRRIELAVTRLAAASPTPRPDPLVYLTGGPGGPALASAAQVEPLGLNRDRDVLFLAQRGTMHSDPFLPCPEIDEFQSAQTGLSPLDPATAPQGVQATRSCRDRVAGGGHDLGAYDTTANAADVADLRVALGLDEWNVYGVSYGTDLALTLLRDHPDGIRSVVLDSVVPTQSNIIEGFWPGAAEGYRALFDACAAQPACAAAYPGLQDEFTGTVNRLAAAPLTVELSGRRVVLDGYTFANLVIQQSLAPGNYAGLPALIHSTATGDGVPAATALLGTVTPPGLIGYGLTFGVFCGEQTSFTDSEQVAATAKRALPDFPDPVLSLVPQAARIFDDCDVWDVPASDARVHQPTASDVPTLLLTGSLDAVTPPSRARTAAESLSRSEVLEFPGLGHDVLQSSDCAPAVTVSFLEKPAGGYDTSCLARVQMPAFTTG